MKSIVRNSLMFSAVLNFLVFSSLAQAAPQSYPLVCKGGGNSELNIYNTAEGTTVLFKFKRSTRGASSGLGKGECAWLDRGISKDEPEWVSMKFNKAHSKVSFVQRNGKLSSYKVATWGDPVSYKKLNKVINDFKHGREFQLHAYTFIPSGGRRRVQNKLVMTKFGP